MMTHEKPARDASIDAATIRALSSITSEQADVIAQAVGVARPEWEIKTTDDYDGYLSILIAPSVSDHRQQSFFVAGISQRLELFEAFDDDLTSLGSFDDAEALLEQLLDLIGQR